MKNRIRRIINAYSVRRVANSIDKAEMEIINTSKNIEIKFTTNFS